MAETKSQIKRKNQQSRFSDQPVGVPVDANKIKFANKPKAPKKSK